MKPLRRSTARPGYVFLISVLVIGAISTATAVSLVLLGLASQLSGQTVADSAQALEFAQTCAERALRSLRANLAYAGDENVSFSNGSCRIELIGGSGNTERYVCTEGSSGGAVRRLEVDIYQLYPTAKIDTWKEVATFSFHCP